MGITESEGGGVGRLLFIVFLVSGTRVTEADWGGWRERKRQRVLHIYISTDGHYIYISTDRHCIYSNDADIASRLPGRGRVAGHRRRRGGQVEDLELLSFHRGDTGMPDAQALALVLGGLTGRHYL